MKEFFTTKKIFFLCFLLFVFSPSFALADSNIVVNNLYDAASGAYCNLITLAGNCSRFTSQLGGIVPTGNFLYVDYNQYGGWGLSNNSVSTPFGTTVRSQVGVLWIPSNLTPQSATYFCLNPNGSVSVRTVPTTNPGSSVFEPVDVVGQDCTVTLNFNQYSDPGSGNPNNPPDCGSFCNVSSNNPSSVTLTVSPASDTVTYGIPNTSYFNVTVNKTGDFGADILVGCEIFIGNGGGECSFVDSSNNPIPRTMYGQPNASAAFTRYPSYFMSQNVSSLNLRLAVRNYDQYGGFSAVKTHLIPIQAGLIAESSLSGATLVCNGSCVSGTNISLIVQNQLPCQSTAGVSATSPAYSNRTFDLSWLPVSGASGYTVEVRDQTSCVLPGCGPLILNTTVSGTSVNVPYGGDVSGVTNKRFGYVIKTNYSPPRSTCSAIGSVLVQPPSSSGGGSGSGSVNLLCNGVQNATISYGQNCNLTWSSTGTVPNSCIASGGWSGTGKPTSNSVGENQTNITSNRSYTLTCNLSGGGTISGTATVNVVGAPTADIKCNGADSCTAIRGIDNVDLSWSCNNSASANVSPGGYSSFPNGFQQVGPFYSGPQTYTLTCTSSSGATAIDSVVINVVDQASHGTYSYSVNPTSFYFNKTRGELFGGSILVTNTGSEILDVSASIQNLSPASPVWVSSLTPSSCNGLHTVSPYNRCLINFGGITDVLPDGINSFNIVFNGTNVPPAQNKTVPVTVEVTGSPSCPNANVVLSSNTVNQGGTVTASSPSGFSNCTFSSSNPSIASVNSTGVVTGNSVGSADISGSYCRYDLSWGGSITCPLGPATINVTPPPAGVYSFSVSGALVFSATQGSLPSPSTKTITVTNNGNQNLNVTRTYNMTTGGVNWGNADSSSFTLALGASRIVNVNITSSSLAPGTYDGMVTFTDANAGQKSVPVTYTVNSSSSTGTVYVTSSWCGVVTSQPSGINCGSTCQFNFNLNTDVTLTATPRPQCIFVGWLGDCVGKGNCVLNINGNKTVTPIFGLKPLNYQEF